MKILLLGGSGQLGLEIVSRAHDLNFEVIAPVPSEVDIGVEGQVSFLARKLKPTIIINCAAYTAVDVAESERDPAFRVNAEGAALVAHAAAEVASRLIHISTDYVFSGSTSQPLDEEAPVAPLNVYGESKLQGEREVLKILGDRALIVRTSSLHARRGVNFVNTMLNMIAQKPVLNVVQDQVMSPTWAGWLAEVLLDLGRSQCGGILHASCAGATTWFEFAQAIALYANLEKKAEILPITAAQFARPARRPAYSVLNCNRLTSILGRSPIPWQQGLKNHLREMGVLNQALEER